MTQTLKYFGESRPDLELRASLVYDYCTVLENTVVYVLY